MIDDNVERLANAYLEDLLDKSKTGWREMPKSRLMMIYRSLKDGQEHLKCYVSLLMSLYERIIVLRSECFDEFHQRYFSQWDDDLSTEVTVKKKSMTLSDAVQWALSFAKEIDYLYWHRDVLKTLADNCRQRQLELSWDNKAENMFELYMVLK